MKNWFRAIWLRAVLLLAATGWQPILAQSGVVVKDSLYSKILGENRRLEIVLPNGGLKTGIKYDLLYVLDGEWNGALVQQIAGFWMNEGLIPPQIIINVLNGEPNMRNRDFTPTHTIDGPETGKADNFIHFLKDELLPYIANKYPGSGYNTLIGHSFGGLFGMYALLKEPGLFNAYILGDPSFWWDNQYMFPLTTATLKPGYKQPTTLFILGRKGNGERLDAEGMDSVLQAVPAGSLNYKIISSPGETHNSTKLRLLVEGLRFVYKGYTGPLQVLPTNGGIVLAGRPFTLYSYNSYTDQVHYHIGGPSSDTWKPLYRVNNLSLDRPADLVLRYSSDRPELRQIIREHFEIGPVIKAEGKPKGNWLPNKTFNLGQLPADATGWKKFDALLEIKQTGYYNLQVMGASAIRWSMNKKLVFKADRAAVNGRYQSVIVPLEVGYYDVHIEVKAQNQDQDAVLLYNTPASRSNDVGLLSDLLYLQAEKKLK